jgi:hypothetical protein
VVKTKPNPNYVEKQYKAVGKKKRGENMAYSFFLILQVIQADLYLVQRFKTLTNTQLMSNLSESAVSNL